MEHTTLGSVRTNFFKTCCLHLQVELIFLRKYVKWRVMCLRCACAHCVARMERKKLATFIIQDQFGDLVEVCSLMNTLFVHTYCQLYAFSFAPSCHQLSVCNCDVWCFIFIPRRCYYIVQITLCSKLPFL